MSQASGQQPRVQVINLDTGSRQVVGNFPDGQSALMLVAARLRHVSGTTWSSRRYLDMEKSAPSAQPLEPSRPAQSSPTAQSA